MGIGYWMETEAGVSGKEPRVVVQVGAQIGQGTNNEAEWQAFLATLRHALRLGFWNLRVRTDSLMVTNQFKGQWKARGRLAKLRDEAVNLSRLFNHLEIYHVRREHNSMADYLSHQLHFEEPNLPLPPEKETSRKKKMLHPWQAAAIRVWWLRHRPGAGTLSRIFGVAPAAIEAIANGKAYRLADFSTFPWAPVQQIQARVLVENVRLFKNLAAEQHPALMRVPGVTDSPSLPPMCLWCEKEPVVPGRGQCATCLAGL